jgi:DNA polymerase-3 subunit alpha
VGGKAVEAIIASRREGGPFRSLHQFCDAVDHRQVHRAVTESLIKCGAFDSLGARRAQLLAALEEAVRMGERVQADRRIGQMSIFDQAAGSAAAEPPRLPEVAEFPPPTLLAMEKETLGFYLSRHPLAQHEGLLERFTTARAEDLPNRPAGERVVVGGLVTKVTVVSIRNGANKGRRMARVQLEDMTGAFEAVVFPKLYESSRALFQKDAILFLEGTTDVGRDVPCVKVNEIVPVLQAEARLAHQVVIKLDCVGLAEETLGRLKVLFQQHPGPCPVLLRFVGHDRQVATLRVARQLGVSWNEELARGLDDLLGPEHVLVAGADEGDLP